MGAYDYNEIEEILRQIVQLRASGTSQAALDATIESALELWRELKPAPFGSKLKWPDDVAPIAAELGLATPGIVSPPAQGASPAAEGAAPGAQSISPAPTAAPAKPAPTAPASSPRPTPSPAKPASTAPASSRPTAALAKTAPTAPTSSALPTAAAAKPAPTAPPSRPTPPPARQAPPPPAIARTRTPPPLPRRTSRPTEEIQPDMLEPVGDDPLADPAIQAGIAQASQLQKLASEIDAAIVASGGIGNVKVVCTSDRVVLTGIAGDEDSRDEALIVAAKLAPGMQIDDEIEVA